MKILVIGSIGRQTDPQKSETIRFTRILGKELMRQGHTLINACQNEFDSILAESAFETLQNTSESSKNRIIGYVADGKQSSHKYGKILFSELKDWELGGPRLRIPEPIEAAEVVIIIGGGDGTQKAANWARIAKKPILPIVKFGGAGKVIYQEERNNFYKSGMINITLSEFEDISETSDPDSELATTVLNLAERIKASKNVLVIMSFSEDSSLEDAYESFNEVCSRFSPEYNCQRMDQITDIKRITTEMISRIKKSAFLIVDLTFERPNVYFELGFADALDKPLIVTAKEGTKIHFDAKDFPIIFWSSQTQLKKDLYKRIQQIASKQGRELN